MPKSLRKFVLILPLCVAAVAPAATRVVGIGIAKSDNHVYAWFDDGMVTSGHSSDFEFYQHATPYTVPTGKFPSGILAISIDGADHCFAWYSDGTVSSGTSSNLASLTAPVPFTMPSGKTIAGIGIAGSNNHVYTWYSDGTASEGTSTKLDAFRSPYTFKLPAGLTTADIVDLDIAEDDHVYAWYRNGTASSGTSGVLDKYLPLFGYIANHVLTLSWPPPVVSHPPDKNGNPFRPEGHIEELPREPGLGDPPPPPPPQHPGSDPGEGNASKPASPAPSTPGPIVNAEFTIDPMIAAGNNFLIASDTDSLLFMDKTGKKLASYSTSDFFNGFLIDQDGHGVFNQSNVNHSLGFSKDCSSFPQTTGIGSCIATFYDTRVYFDRQSQRFFIIAAAQNPLWVETSSEHPGSCGFYQVKVNKVTTKEYLSDPGQCHLMRRYVAFAVSKTEDPRGGFFQYMLVDNQPADFPWMSVHNGRVIISHHAPSAAWPVPVPVAEVFDTTSLASGVAHPPRFRYFPKDLGGMTAVLPPDQQGDTGSAAWILANDASVVRMFAIPLGGGGWSSPPLLTGSIDLGANPPGVLHAVFRGGRLHLAGDELIEEEGKAKRYSIRIVRIPLTLHSGSSTVTLSQDPNAGYLDQAFGHNATSDNPADRVSYDKPSIAVNAKGDILIGYRRVPFVTVKPLFPEARYSLWPAGDALPLRSALLHKGAAPQVSNAKTDYTTVVVDPMDDSSFWVALPFADAKGGYNRVIGHVVP